MDIEKDPIETERAYAHIIRLRLLIYAMNDEIALLEKRGQLWNGKLKSKAMMFQLELDREMDELGRTLPLDVIEEYGRVTTAMQEMLYEIFEAVTKE
jgi:hypothetical protein